MLQNALGGNSKTYMICAIRPGAKFFDESVNTLKYADRAKQIKNKAVINENPQDKLIRELKEENERLKKQLAEGGGGQVKIVTEKDETALRELALMKEQLEANQRLMADMERSWEDKLADAKKAQEEDEKRMAEEARAQAEGKPHLLNLNEDPQLDRKVQYDIKPEEPLFCGRRNKASNFKLQLAGSGIQPEHCKFVLDPNQTFVFLTPLDPKAVSQIRVNGQVLQDMSGIKLRPNDRICIGPSSLFIYKNKKKDAEASMKDDPSEPVTFEMAFEEVCDAENGKNEAEKQAILKKQEEDAKKAMEELNAQLKKEEEEKKAELAKLNADIAKLKQGDQT